ncbi:MAG: HK97 family phage prohead protease [Candidatus Absconditabacterales bacterium]|jgi:phage head maturation protease
MPLPAPENNEARQEFLDRCMGDQTMNDEYQDASQRFSVCSNLWERKNMDDPMDNSPSKFYITGAANSIDRDSRTMTIVASDKLMDRDGDVVEPRGIDLTNYKMNPVILAFHDYNKQPIAKALEITVNENQIIMKIQFKDRGLAKDIFEDYAEGYMNMWSMGFLPKKNKVEEIWGEPNEDGESRLSGFHILEWDLLEVSAVPIPANPRAMTLSKSLNNATYKNQTDETQIQKPVKNKTVSASVKINSLSENGNFINEEFSKTALKKSILERVEANKIPYEIKEVDELKDTGIVLECTAMDMSNDTITQARIEKIVFMIPSQKKEIGKPSDEMKRPELIHQISETLAQAEMETKFLNLED